MKNKIILFAIAFFIVHCTLIIENCMCRWQTYTLPYNGLANELAFYNLNTGVSCGHTVFQFTEKIYYTTNSGINWILATFPPEIRALVNLQFISSSTVYACGAENVYGLFTKSYNPGFSTLPFYLRERFISKGISEYFSEYKSAFLKSVNAGVTWTKIGQFDTTTGYINDIHFFNENTGYAIIDTNPSTNPKFYKTTNGGLNWIFVKKIQDSIFLDNMHFMDMNTGFVCGATYILNQPVQYGLIFKTTNAGLNWIKTSKPNTNAITDFTFFNSNTGIAIATAEPLMTKFFRTTNAGNTWDSVAAIQNRIMYNISCISNSGIAFAVGNILDTVTGIGKISTAKTTNYGNNWTVKELNQYSLITGIAMVDQNNFFISGGLNDAAVILKSTNGGNVFINQIGSEVPSEYKLYQNYPNPFNQSSIIKFQCSIKSELSLKLFDILGQEVTTLFNEQFRPGIYEIKFYARHGGSSIELPSGIYFYQLKAADYLETKRMIIIK
ncbi:MAG: T9SS type A sorting domain-containing protein [Ignavibacteria bacterium]|nr:T9SS type A sorting domain-containing protein [Ignavibacteria bacterium]